MQLQRIAPILVVFTTCAAFAGQPLQVAVGAQRVVTVPGMQRLAVGKAHILEVHTAGQDVVLVGASPGKTELRIWKEGVSAPEVFDVTVTAAPASTDPTPITFTPTIQRGAKVSRPAPNLKRVAIGDPNIADLEVENDAITLSGNTAGRTTVLLWFADGHREQWLVTVLQ